MQPGLLAFRHSCKKSWNADSTDKISIEFPKSKQKPPPLASYKTSAGMNFFLMTESLVTWDTNESNRWFPCTFSQFKVVESAGVWGYVLIQTDLPRSLQGRNKPWNVFWKTPVLTKTSRKFKLLQYPPSLSSSFYPTPLIKHLKAMLETSLKQENQVTFTCLWKKVKFEA